MKTYQVYSYEGASMHNGSLRIKIYELIEIETEELIINGEKRLSFSRILSEPTEFVFVENSRLELSIRSKFNTDLVVELKLSDFNMRQGPMFTNKPCIYYHKDVDLRGL